MAMPEQGHPQHAGCDALATVSREQNDTSILNYKYSKRPADLHWVSLDKRDKLAQREIELGGNPPNDVTKSPPLTLFQEQGKHLPSIPDAAAALPHRRRSSPTNCQDHAPGAISVPGLLRHAESPGLYEMSAPDLSAPLVAELVVDPSGEDPEMEEQRLEERVRQRTGQIADYVMEQLRQATVTADVVVMDSINTDSNQAKESTSNTSQRNRHCNELRLGVLIIVIIVVLVVAAVLSVVLLPSTKHHEVSPTPPPTVTRLQTFRSLFIAKAVSGTDLWNETTPQFRALQWLSDVDHAKLEVNTTSFDTIKERYIMALIYFANNGDSWPRKCGFLSGAPICLWQDMITNTGVFCDVHNQTQTLSLVENMLDGAIPSEIGRLSNLTKLNFFRNFLTGTIPTEIGLLRHLETLLLANNSLVGPIPSDVWRVSSLRTLYFWGNQLTGSLSSDIGMLSQMEQFDVITNILTGTIPSEIGMLSNLVLLHLGDNRIAGTLPTQIGTLRNLTDFDLGFDSLTGSIPSEIWSLSLLQVLKLSVNHMTGTISSQIGYLSNLGTLYLFSNNITGTLPTEIGKLQAIIEFVANRNAIHGPIPSELGNMSSLQSLRIWTNRLTGTLPSEVGKLIRLNYLDVSDNKLNGTVPSVLAALPALENLFVQLNDFHGDLTPFFCSNRTNKPAWKFFWSDCIQDVECSCCTECCENDSCFPHS